MLLNPLNGDFEVLDADVAGTLLQKSFSDGILSIRAETPQPLSAFTSVLRTLTYDHLGIRPSEGDRTIRVVVNDGVDDSPIAVAIATVRVPQDSSSISGYVYVDANSNGARNEPELGLPGLPITIQGTVSRTVITNADGSYAFLDLPAGRYDVAETQPLAFYDGPESPDTPASGRVENDRFVDLELPSGVALKNYNFGELSLRLELLTKELLFAQFSVSDYLQQLDIMNGVR